MHNTQLINQENAQTVNLQDYNDLWTKFIFIKNYKIFKSVDDVGGPIEFDINEEDFPFLKARIVKPKT